MSFSDVKRECHSRMKEFKKPDLLIIASEGEKTEKNYFDQMRSDYPESNVYPVTFPSEKGLSAPQHIIENLDKIKSDHGIETDEFWLMIDVDRWKDNLPNVARQAIQKGYKLAISNPCFECWLHFHFSDIDPSDTTSVKMTKSLRKVANGYTKSKINWDKYHDKVADAVEQAKKNDRANNDTRRRWPLKPGTHVYKVVDKIISG
jgi:hypothetical protein